jgi:hypothetical protein
MAHINGIPQNYTFKNDERFPIKKLQKLSQNSSILKNDKNCVKNDSENN